MSISGEQPAGVDVVVSKPIEVRELIRIVEELLASADGAGPNPAIAPETQR